MTKLTGKQAAFVDEYLIDLNATQAAIRAGYSEKAAASIGCKNLMKPDIQVAIAAAKENAAENYHRRKEDALADIARILTDATTQKGDNGMRSRSDALRALEREAKMMGWDSPEKLTIGGGTDNKHTIEIIRPDGAHSDPGKA